MSGKREAMREISQDLFKQMPLRVHGFLAGIPLRTLYRVDLPGGYQGLTMREISAITGFGGEGEIVAGPMTNDQYRIRIERMLLICPDQRFYRHLDCRFLIFRLPIALI